ncbi:hypothetical protein ACQ4PT_018975 [Festuca glaucescens]
MQGCFPFRSTQRQAPRHGGGVTVVSRGEGDGSVKIVVSRGELERIATGVTRMQCGGATAASLHRHVEPPPAFESLRVEQQPCDPLLRRRPELEVGAAARRGQWRPALSGIPEEA